MTTLLTIENVTLTFPLIERKILADVSYKINQGDFVIILGGNGSGKSSLLKLIDKRYTPSKGAISYKGKNLKQLTSATYYRSVKTITQSSSESLFQSLTVFENYKLFSALGLNPLQSRQELEHYLAQFNQRLAHKLNQQVTYLSGGEKQALVLALTMIDPPELLLLDEHTSALDPKSADNIIHLTIELVKKYNVTCMLTTHDLQLASRHGDRLLALKDGSVYRTIELGEKKSLTADRLRELCY